MLSFKPRVGQVIYVLIHLKEQTGLDSNLSLHPVQIVEEITKVTLTGTEKSFMCKEGSSGKIFPIEGLKGPVFENSQEASRFLSLKMKEHVEKTVLTASKLASKLFGVKDENFSTASHINDDIINSFRQEELEDELDTPDITTGTVVDLGNGMIGRLRPSTTDSFSQ